MSEFRADEIVDITIKGARIMAPRLGVSDVLTLAYEEVEPGVFATIELRHPRARSVTIGRAAPAEWPPRRGDLWRDRDGGLWFAQDDGASDVTPPVMWMVRSVPLSGGDNGMQAARLFAGHSPLTLVYREPDGGQS